MSQLAMERIGNLIEIQSSLNDTNLDLRTTPLLDSSSDLTAFPSRRTSSLNARLIVWRAKIGPLI